MLHGFLILRKRPLCTLSSPFFYYYLPGLRGFLRCTQDKLLALPTFYWHGLRGSNSRHLVLETSALPTELNPSLLVHMLRIELVHPFSAPKGAAKNSTFKTQNVGCINLIFQLPDLHLQYDLLRESQNEDLRSMQ